MGTNHVVGRCEVFLSWGVHEHCHKEEEKEEERVEEQEEMYLVTFHHRIRWQYFQNSPVNKQTIKNTHDRINQLGQGAYVTTQLQLKWPIVSWISK